MITPLNDAIHQEIAAGRMSSHTPGHRNGRIIPPAQAGWGKGVFAGDLTEIGDLDVLSAPQGVLQESQSAVAALHGAVAARYLVGGSTVGLLAALWAGAQHSTVLVGRHAHPSVWHGLALAGAKAVAITPEMDETWGIVNGLRANDLEDALDQYPEATALILTDPTYEGRSGENAALLAWAKEQGLLVVVDAAHGAHYPFHAALPNLLAGDVVVTSAHKMLPVLTGASLMLIYNEALIPALDGALAMLQTSSPSYLMLASLEGAYAMMDACGEALLTQGLARLAQASMDLPPRYTLAAADDPLRWLLGGVSPRALGDALAAAGHRSEAVCGEGLLLLHGLDGPAPGLMAALKSIHLPEMRRIADSGDLPRYAYLDLRTALAPPYGTIPLAKAAGKRLAQVLAPYPPGIPLGLPGESITPAMIQQALQVGLSPQQPIRWKGVC